MCSFFKVVTRCGLRVSPPQLLIEYEAEGKRKLHVINVKQINKAQSFESFTNKLRDDIRHGEFIKQIPRSQLIRLMAILCDLINGKTLEESLKYNDAVELISPMEDLNKESDSVIHRKKLIMDELYEENLIGPDDPNFQYDLTVDFPEQKETSGWDSDISDF